MSKLKTFMADASTWKRRSGSSSPTLASDRTRHLRARKDEGLAVDGHGFGPVPEVQLERDQVEDAAPPAFPAHVDDLAATRVLDVPLQRPQLLDGGLTE